MLTGIIAGVFALLTLAGCLYTLAALVCLIRYARQPDAESSSHPPVTVLKPLHGDEPRLYETLASTVAQDYPGPVRIVFGVSDPADPATAVVDRLHAAFPAADLHLVVDPMRHGRNGKVSNLVNMSAAVWSRRKGTERAAPSPLGGEGGSRPRRETDEGSRRLSPEIARPLIRRFAPPLTTPACFAGRGPWPAPPPSPSRGEDEHATAAEFDLDDTGNDIVVLADSDMLVEPDYLTRVVGALQQPGVGAVTCLYRGVSLPNLWSRLATGWVDGQFLPNVILGLSLGLAKPCMGSTIALRRDTLERIGGFAAFADLLADDYEIGAAIRRLGLRVVVPARPVLGHISAATSLGALLRQELRWTRTIKTVDFAGFAGSAVTHVHPFALLTAIADGFRARDFLLLALVLLLRSSLLLHVKRVVRKDTADLSLFPIRDLLSFAVFCGSFLPGSIEWRGHRFGVRSDGILTAPDDTGH